jgi:hypothetical protein
MDTGFVLFVCIALVILVVGVYFYTNDKRAQEVKIVVEREAAPAALKPYDHRIPPPPEQSYATPPDVRGFMPPPGVPVIPIQVPTQGLPSEFQQMGVLAAAGGSGTSASPNRTLIPLFGRRVAVSRNRYNYYSRTDGFNPMQVSVTYKNRNCDDDNGCDEIMSGDTVGIPQLGQTFTATIHRFNLPRYIPLV